MFHCNFLTLFYLKGLPDFYVANPESGNNFLPYFCLTVQSAPTISPNNAAHADGI